MKITLVIASLGAGGAERVLTLLAAGFVARGHEITVITLDRQVNDFYSLPKAIRRVSLDAFQESGGLIPALRHNTERLRKLRSSIRLSDPGCVISFCTETNVLTLLSLLGANVRVIVTEHCDPTRFKVGAAWNLLRYMTYNLSFKVASVSKGVSNGFRWLPRKRNIVIYNPIVITESSDHSSPETDGLDATRKWLVSMGRLADQKGFDILINAYSRIAADFPDWQLIIIGDGELHEKLSRLIFELGQTRNILLVGRLKNPFAVLKQARIFVMASRFEGFPMAHGEALLCGVPVIATNCPSGPNELIRDGVDGVLVPVEDVDTLSITMKDLMVDKDKRKCLTGNAQDVGNRFSLDKILGNWEDVIGRET